MAVLVASMESLFLSGHGEQCRYPYNNVSAHSHHHMITGHTSCLDSDIEDDDEDVSDLTFNLNSDLAEAWKYSLGSKQHGCSHYRRRCKIIAPCCNKTFSCRHCHNEEESHEIDRHAVERVICTLCSHEQAVQQVCESCGVCMGEYFCSECNFFDDDTSKQQYHCEECGICRSGGRENFFHCDKCGCCYSVSLREGHTCVEKSMHQDCPVCMEFLFDSLKDINVLPCGHTLHLECLQEMHKHCQYNCPLCSKSVCDMSEVWKEIDQEIAANRMPADQIRNVWVLCNDCGSSGKVQYHIIGQKCSSCPSYNTRIIEPPVVASS